MRDLKMITRASDSSPARLNMLNRASPDTENGTNASFSGSCSAPSTHATGESPLVGGVNTIAGRHANTGPMHLGSRASLQLTSPLMPLEANVSRHSFSVASTSQSSITSGLPAHLVKFVSCGTNTPSIGWDTRTHVVSELYDTEKSYVESLKILVNKYMSALKTGELVDCSLVDEIFYQIPEILEHHEAFLESLRQRLANWDSKQKVGDVFLEAFTKQPIIDTYTAFINNWKNAKEAIKLASQAKPAFAKFLETMSREHKGKLTLDAILIMPVQRIPRYELLIKELLKHTIADHPDHHLLLTAQKEIHVLALNINSMEKETALIEQSLQKVKEIESLIEGAIDLVHPERTFVRFECVFMPGGLGTKKERCIFLFSDLLIIASIKKKNVANRKASSVSGSPSPFGTLEGNKYKLLMKFALENADIAKTNDANLKKAIKDIENFQEDLGILNQISDLSSNLNCTHVQLDESIKELFNSISKQLNDKQNNDAQLLSLDLCITTQDSMEHLCLYFPSTDRRAAFQTAFHQTKQQLIAKEALKRPAPQFQQAIPIRKTRAGLQFSCASATLAQNPLLFSQIPTVETNSGEVKEVWVCNSDGYVGQVCVLSLTSEPTVTSCNGVCNSRILCIAAVPAYRRKSFVPEEQCHTEDVASQTSHGSCVFNKPVSGASVSRSSTNASSVYSASSASNAESLELRVLRGSTTSDTKVPSGSSGSGSSNSTPTTNGASCVGTCPIVTESRLKQAISSLEREGLVLHKQSEGTLINENTYKFLDNPSGSQLQLDSESSDEEEKTVLPETLPCDLKENSAANLSEKTKQDYQFDAANKETSSSTKQKSPVDPVDPNSELNQPTMWLGTEDGCIHVYNCNDNIRIKKNKVKVHLNTTVTSIVYLENRVFAGLQSGEVAIFSRSHSGLWLTASAQLCELTKGPIIKMVAVCNRLWVAVGNELQIFDPNTLQNVNTIKVSLDTTKHIQCLVASGLGVWLSTARSSIVRLYHATSMQFITEVNVAPAVNKILTECNDIIRQHKAACLRVTSMLACKELLWIGTSAGALCTLQMPMISLSTQQVVNLPTIHGISHGHTGHVRFLTSVQLPDPKADQSESSSDSKTRTLVISGGDGYENFSCNSTNEGRDDSTNHLLLWNL